MKTRSKPLKTGSGFSAVLNRVNDAKLRFMTPIMLLVMALLVFCEYRYNVDLLNGISDPETRPEVAEVLSQRGKLLAAFGITWALFRNSAFKFRNVLAGLFFLASLTFGAYVALDTLYAKAIDILPPHIKVMGYNLLLYRHDLLTGDLEDPDIPNVKEEPVDGKIFMGAFPMVLLDERFMVPAQAYVIRRADLKAEESLRLAEEKWPLYEKNMSELEAGYEKFIAWSKRAAGDGLIQEWGLYALRMQKLDEAFQHYRETLDMATQKADLAAEWNAYNTQMNLLRARHKEFVDGSHKVAQYAGGKHEAEAKNRFRAASGGLEPNARVSLAEFPALLKRSSHGKKINAGEKRVVAHGPDGSPILAGEIPYFLDRPGFETWVSGRAAQALRSVGLSSNGVMTREQFLDWARTSQTPGGENLRMHEARNYGPPEHPVPGRDIPYFMERDEFIRWTGHKVREVLLAYDMPPDPELNREGFLALLRKAKSREGEQLRAAENRLLAALPDGTRLKVGDVPYFMDRESYLRWARDEVERLKINLVPTEENIAEFATINQSNAAVFVPPMAIVSSLTSALVNALSLLILLVASALASLSATRKAGILVGKLAVPLMLACFFALILAMPSHVFRQGTEAWNLESKFHEQVGLAARLWSRLSNVQKIFL